MKLNIAELRELELQKLLKSSQKGDRISWCYTDYCDHERLWNPTLLVCRGIITDLEGEVIARPFVKFFNTWEKPDEWQSYVNRTFEATDKLDGSLIIATSDRNDVLVASKNSFKSDQANFAATWLEEHPKVREFIKNDVGVTWVMEAIFPENRGKGCIINYGDRRELVLLALICTETGSECPRYIMEEVADHVGISVAPTKRYETLDAATTDAQSGLVTNQCEGIVLKFDDGTRFKVKSLDYVRIHRLYSTASLKNVWKILSSDGNIADIYSPLPDDMYKKVLAYEGQLLGEYESVLEDVRVGFEAIRTIKSRKEQSLAILNNARWFAVKGALYEMLDGRDITPVVWKIVRKRLDI